MAAQAATVTDYPTNRFREMARGDESGVICEQDQGCSANVSCPFDDDVAARKRNRAEERRRTKRSSIDNRYSDMMDRFKLRASKKHLHSSLHKRDTKTTENVSPMKSPSPAVGCSQLAWLKIAHQAVVAPLHPSSYLARTVNALATSSVALQLVFLPLSIVRLAEADDDSWYHSMEDVVQGILWVDIAMKFNTAYMNRQGVLETTRKRIAWNYLTTWFTFDILACCAPEKYIHLKSSHIPLVLIVCGVLRVVRLLHCIEFARRLWLSRARGTDEQSVPRVLRLVIWVMYSRNSHLIGVGQVLAGVLLFVHYLTCMWIASKAHDTAAAEVSASRSYVHGFYIILQLLHGQGFEAETEAYNVFASAGVLLGSIMFALVYAHVGMLVANFSSNETDYQRKMEEVFSITQKIGLPTPLCNRISQYYEYLHYEYESLDGCADSFARGLSHTLGVEVVLYKYMELVTHIPIWSECSADFVQQIVCHIQVRIYLADDFIMRRGEVGDEFYMINKGECELIIGPDSFEHATSPLRANRGTHTPTKPSADQDDSYSTVLCRGQAFGEIALVMNYARTATCRAMTPTEIAVLHRDDFQNIMVRFPVDRHVVIETIFQTCMQNNEAHQVYCPLKELVRLNLRESDPEAASTLTATHAAKLISVAADPSLDDESIRFGVTNAFHDRLADNKIRHVHPRHVHDSLRDAIQFLQRVVIDIENTQIRMQH